MTNVKDLPINYGVLVFPGFQALDAFGPLDALNVLSYTFPMNVSIISQTLDPVSTKPRTPVLRSAQSDFAQSIVPTHTFSQALDLNLDVLIIPGGQGVREDSITDAIEFVHKVYPKLKYLFTVCTGSWIAARAGVLDGKRATSNKKSWHALKDLGTKEGDFGGKIQDVDWVSHARWVVDGNIWTTSGVSAGIDGVFAFIEEVYGKEAAENIQNTLEYDRHRDPSWDPWADLHGL